MPSTKAESAVRFDDFVLDLETGELWRNAMAVPLRPLCSRALVELASRPGRLVTREELRRTLWGETAVEWNQGLNQCVRQIRRALGDDAARPAYIETVPRRGYRFIASISGPSAGCRARARPGGWVRPFFTGFAAALLLPAGVLLVCVLLGLG